MKQMKRTLAIETKDKVGEMVMLQGWVNSRRDHGRVVFLDIRDRSGILQTVTADAKLVERVGSEYCVELVGIVKERPENMVNTDLATGKVELEIKEFKVLTESSELPLHIDTDGTEIDEGVRMKYRYLDLRRKRMNHHIKIRSKTSQFMRQFLLERDFVEVETPILTKTTPEGARDFLVPSRLQQGNFYALPQSPQQYKQLLMVAGFERYFQLARCFRDEDPRADRAYGEFTQLDIEMSFVSQEDILQIAEELFTSLAKTLFHEKKINQSPWPRISHAEAMKRYHSDKPDLRKNKMDKNELAFAWVIDFPLFNKQAKEEYYYGAGKKVAPSHHMFTAPHPDDMKVLNEDPLKVRGLQHDMILNGYEVGGGSIRIHDPAIQEKVFELIGFTEAQKKQFEHMLTAFTNGVPPHGGIAPGLDRYLMAALGEPSVRELIGFPASSGGFTAAVNAPSEATEEQLKELGIRVDNKRTS